MASQFQLYQDKKGEFRWRLLAENNETIAQSSEGYKKDVDAQRAIEVVKTTGMKASPEIFRDNAGQFRFRLTAPNGNIVAAGEAYKSEADCSRAVSLIHELAPKAPVKVVDKK